MISTQEAFKKFRSRLELNQREQQDASRRQQRIRAVMDEALATELIFHGPMTVDKTKPLKDVDIFCVLGRRKGIAGEGSSGPTGGCCAALLTSTGKRTCPVSAGLSR
jgi:hypothetical protein